jgi:deoxycytidylate deaminase
MRSKDPSTQCGACIVKDNRQIGIGYNGMIDGIDDCPEIWDREEKKKYIYHAEENAVRNSRTTDFSKAAIYIWTSNPMIYLPCERCARTLVHYGIRDIHVLGGEDIVELAKSDTRWNVSTTLDIFERVGIQYSMHDRAEVNKALVTIATEKL